MKFDISKNGLYAAGGKAIAEALSRNQVMTELNLARNDLGLAKWRGDADMTGVSAIANAIPTMGALTSLTISGDQWISKPVTIETSMTEADFSFKVLNVSAIMLAAFLPKCR